MREGWRSKRFAECIEKVVYTRKLRRTDFLDEGSYPVVSQEAPFINGYWSDPADLFKVTTPVVVFGDHTMVLKFVDFDFVLGADGVKVLLPRPFLHPKFFFYQLQAADLRSQGYARHYRLLKELTITYPNRPAQERIAGILDAAFEAIAKARENAEKNLRHSCAVVEGHLASLLSPRGDEWEERPLIDFVEGISTGPFGSVLHKSDYQSGGVPLVNPINIRGQRIIPDARKTVGPQTALRLAAYALREGDVVVARRGEMGRCAVVTGGQSGWLCGTGCFVVRPSERTDGRFLAHLIASRPYRERLERLAARATIPNIGNGDLARLEVAMPPIARQRAVVATIDDLSGEAGRLESTYSRKITALEELKMSLLHEAFAGNL